MCALVLNVLYIHVIFGTIRMPIPSLLSPRWRDALLQCPSPPGTAAPLVPPPATRPSPVPGLINKRAAEFRVWASATSGLQSPGTGGQSPRGQGITPGPGRRVQRRLYHWSTVSNLPTTLEFMSEIWDHFKGLSTGVVPC